MPIHPKFKTFHRAEDELLYLYMLYCMKDQRAPKRLEQKLLFLIQYRSFQNEDRILDIKFEMGSMGPMSPLIYDIRYMLASQTIVDLESKRYVNQDIDYATLTETGTRLLSEFEENLEPYPWVLQYIEDVVKEFGDANARELTENYIDNLEIGGKKIREYVLKEPIPFIYKKIKRSFDFDFEWKETYMLLRDPGFWKQLKDTSRIPSHPAHPFVPLE